MESLSKGISTQTCFKRIMLANKYIETGSKGSESKGRDITKETFAEIQESSNIGLDWDCGRELGDK